MLSILAAAGPTSTPRGWAIPRRIRGVRRLAAGALERTLRVPQGARDLDKVYAVAIFPDGAQVAAGGWTGPVAGTNPVYIFDQIVLGVPAWDGVAELIAHNARGGRSRMRMAPGAISTSSSSSMSSRACSRQ